MTCYKPHKVDHESTVRENSLQTTRKTGVRIDRPGTTQRVAKPRFDGFESDAEFQRLLLRYPSLKTELQGLFALTLDPGPEESRSWNKIWLPLLDRPAAPHTRAMRARGRATRGRGSSHQRGGLGHSYEPPEGREHGQWSKEKGDREALFVMKKVQTDIDALALSEGLQEFVELANLRFGMPHDGDQNGSSQRISSEML